ncbi:hypothetical protein SSPO_051470 [Streptomyces antimycoticus]|uniref:Transposase IS204/IS1001/IS1096/IS1165 zinc-finger domain-containing protein n=1 Tax=Streptomyces antimycoticus TaxID=68175 RepID=A0A499V0F3_9ACTN|nr:hypothetical protein SSPO_051470 [Streptomyces antimycoticus]
MADTIIRTVELGVRITDAAPAGETTVVFTELIAEGPGCCPGCGLVGVYRDRVERKVTDVPVVGHPLELRARVPRYRCTHDGHVREVFAHDTSRLARPGASTTRRCAQYIPRRLAIDRASGVDEHKWSHVLGRQADGFVTVITDLTSVVADKGPCGCWTWSRTAPRPR